MKTVLCCLGRSTIKRALIHVVSNDLKSLWVIPFPQVCLLNCLTEEDNSCLTFTRNKYYDTYIGIILRVYVSIIIRLIYQENC